jgi:hypothetical protein
MSIKKLFRDQIVALGGVVNRLVSADRPTPDAPTILTLVRAQIQLSTAIPFVEEPEQKWVEGDSKDEQPDDLSPDEKKAESEKVGKYEW